MDDKVLMYWNSAFVTVPSAILVAGIPVGNCPAGYPVQFDRLPDDGVPNTGSVNVGAVKVLLINV